MCFQDWRIGRLIRSVAHDIVSGPAGEMLLPASQQRVGLTVTAVDSDIAAGWLVQAYDSNLKLAFLLGLNSGLFHCTLATHGDLPTRSITIEILGNTTTAVSVIEYFAPEEYLAAALESFRTQYGMKGY